MPDTLRRGPSNGQDPSYLDNIPEKKLTLTETMKLIKHLFIYLFI
jgi:hypothetical protein